MNTLTDFREYSVRQERKIRPGYTPPEDVAIYRARGAVETHQRKAVKGSVPGLKPTEVPVKGIGSTKAQKRSAKRAEKREEGKEGVAGGEKEANGDTPDSWDAAEDEPKHKVPASEPSRSVPAPVSSSVPLPPGATHSSSSSYSSSSAKLSTLSSFHSLDIGEEEKRVRGLRKKLRQVRFFPLTYLSSHFP